jgi:hypothetical protein
MRWTVVAAAAQLVACLVATQSSGAPASAKTAPSLRVFATTPHIVAVHRPGRYAVADPGIEVAPVGGDFVLHVARAGYASPVEVRQETTGGEIQLPSDVLDGWTGLAGFLRITIRDSEGRIVSSWPRTFCPNQAVFERIDPSSVSERTFPLACPSDPFTLGSVWGIDSGWAVDAFGGSFEFGLKDGRYLMTVAITPRFRDLFGVAPGDGSASVHVTVKTGTPPSSRAPLASDTRSRVPGSPRHPADQAPQDALPDLVPLPATRMAVVHRAGRDFLGFEATVWIGGNGPLEIQGFRRPSSNVMDAYQYFSHDGTQEGNAPAGRFRFESRPGHDHWHYMQFARYSLLISGGSELLRSHKARFCLEPSDAIDLLVPGADLRPDLGTQTDCGTASSQWVREILPVGWGDTYEQLLPGQSFDVTKVPNGRYEVRIQANPLGLVSETDTPNDVSVRRIRLMGRPGHRHVCVPAFDGLDAEGCPSR